MIRRITNGLMCIGFVVVLLPISATFSADEASSELLKMIVTLIADKDQDFRAAGLDHVRSGAKGPAATKLFTDQLPVLPPAVQVSLLNALSDRGDIDARTAILQLQRSSQDESVRAAAIIALGRLGNASDLPMLVDSLTSKSDIEQTAASHSLSRLSGDDVTKLLATQLNNATPVLKA